MGGLKFTKFGLTDALLSLIPIFPTWTLFPGVFAGKILGDLLNNCEQGYRAVLWISLFLSVLFIYRYLIGINHISLEETERQLKSRFRLFSLGIYTLLNTSILLIILGANLACYGDGQTLLTCIYSGPLASIGLIILGLIVDLKLEN
jgi:hypothetical protein